MVTHVVTIRSEVLVTKVNDDGTWEGIPLNGEVIDSRVETEPS